MATPRCIRNKAEIVRSVQQFERLSGRSAEKSYSAAINWRGVRELDNSRFFAKSFQDKHENENRTGGNQEQT